MKNIILLTFLIVALGISCSQERLCSTLPLAQGSIIFQDEYSIVDAIIDFEFKDNGFLHFYQESISSTNSDFLLTTLANSEIKFDKTAIDEYTTLINTPVIWGDNFQSSKKLINKDEFDCFFDLGNGWIDYFEKHDHSLGLLKFTRPFINENGEAFLECSLTCGFQCGGGYIGILKKEGQEWVVKEIIHTWIR